MSTKTPAPVGKTRWRRFGVAAGAGFGVVALILYLTMSGALALNFALSGIPFSLKATELRGNNFVQFAAPDQLGPAAANSEPFVQGGARAIVNQGNTIAPIPAGGPDNVRQGSNGTFYASDTVSQFGTATITGLQQSICSSLDSLGLPFATGTGIRVTILGTGDTTASNLTVQAPALSASSARFNSIRIGTLTAQAQARKGVTSLGDLGYPAELGASFAQEADSVVLSDVNQLGIGTEAGVFTIGGLRLWATFVDSCTG